MLPEGSACKLRGYQSNLNCLMRNILYTASTLLCSFRRTELNWTEAKSRAWLSDFTFIFHFHALEKAMAPHSSTILPGKSHGWKPDRLQSMGSLIVGNNKATSLSFFTFMHWRRQWQPTPVFLPGESQGWGSLVGRHLWGHTESDPTEVT